MVPMSKPATLTFPMESAETLKNVSLPIVIELSAPGATIGAKAP